MPQAWTIRAGQDDEYLDIAFARHVIVLGWGATGDLATNATWSDIHGIVKGAYPDFTPFTKDACTRQLYAFRTVIAKGDLVVLLQHRSPDVSVCEVVGGYQYTANNSIHVRRVRWLQRGVHRSTVGVDLLDPPALAMLHHINKPGALERLQQLVGTRSAAAASAGMVAGSDGAKDTPPSVETPASSDAYLNLTKNLNYARNLTSAGIHFSGLGVTKFEVADVYRAAWVQAVAALDQWVRREIHERMLLLCDSVDVTKPEKYRSFDLSLGAMEDIRAGSRTLRDALDERLREKLGFTTYQDPTKIRQGFAHVTDETNFWSRVARVLNEQRGSDIAITGQNVEQRLREIVHRRHKIAHEYDEDATSSTGKRPVSAEETMATIEFIDRVAAAVTVVLGGPGSSGTLLEA